MGVPDMSAGSVPYARAALASAGIDPQTNVKWLSIGIGGQAANAFRQNVVDGWAAWDTVIASLENNGFKLRYIDPPWLDEILGNVIVAREETIAKHPDLVIKVARGIAKSSVFGLANPDGALRNHALSEIERAVLHPRCLTLQVRAGWLLSQQEKSP